MDGCTSARQTASLCLDCYRSLGLILPPAANEDKTRFPHSMRHARLSCGRAGAVAYPKTATPWAKSRGVDTLEIVAFVGARSEFRPAPLPQLAAAYFAHVVLTAKRFQRSDASALRFRFRPKRLFLQHEGTRVATNRQFLRKSNRFPQEAHGSSRNGPSEKLPITAEPWRRRSFSVLSKRNWMQIWCLGGSRGSLAVCITFSFAFMNRNRSQPVRETLIAELDCGVG
jgi:hypothetical protein